MTQESHGPDGMKFADVSADRSSILSEESFHTAKDESELPLTYDPLNEDPCGASLGPSRPDAEPVHQEPNDGCLLNCPSYRANQCPEQRWRYVKDSGACFRCLRYGHQATECPKGACNVDGCLQRHHPTLHVQEQKRFWVSDFWTEPVAKGGLSNWHPSNHRTCLSVQVVR